MNCCNLSSGIKENTSPSIAIPTAIPANVAPIPFIFKDITSTPEYICPNIIPTTTNIPAMVNANDTTLE